jgi:hypothetical protein
VQHWLKVMHRFTPQTTEVGDPHGRGPLGEPLRRPAYAPRDPVLVYLASTYRCPAVCEIAGDPWFDPERDRWGWRTPVRVLAVCALDEAPLLADAGVPTRSVGRQSRLRLRPEQFAPVAAQVTRASSSAMSS